MKRIRRDTNISILYLNISIIMYQNVPIELIERIEALERRMEKNWEGDPLQPPPRPLPPAGTPPRRGENGGFADIADKLFKKNSLRRVQNRGAKVGVFFNVNVNVFVGKANGVQSPRRALPDADNHHGSCPLGNSRDVYISHGKCTNIYTFCTLFFSVPSDNIRWDGILKRCGNATGRYTFYCKRSATSFSVFHTLCVFK